MPPTHPSFDHRAERERDVGRVFPINGTLRIGTRGSALALRQTERVVEALTQYYPDLTCDVQVVSTSGDRDKETSLQIIGGQGIFAKELQLALINGEIDIAVHSVKDLTSTLPEGLTLEAIVERADPRDVVISNLGGLPDLPEGSVVGTSSRRRLALVRRLRPDLTLTDLRGNVDTRIRKATEGPLDAAILAAAGIQRMGWQDRVRQYLSVDEFVPAPGQGAIGVEVREDNTDVRELLAPLNDPDLALAVESERTFLRTVGGGCTSPIGAHTVLDGDAARITTMMATEDLEQIRIDARDCSRDGVLDVAREMAQTMLRELSIEARHT